MKGSERRQNMTAKFKGQERKEGMGVDEIT